jgi:hypothetical protein
MQTHRLKSWAQLIKQHNVEAYRVWKYSVTILKLSTGWSCVVSFIPLPFNALGNSPMYSYYWKLQGIGEPIWKLWKR